MNREEKFTKYIRVGGLNIGEKKLQYHLLQYATHLVCMCEQSPSDIGILKWSRFNIFGLYSAIKFKIL